MDVTKIARVVHEANRALQIEQADHTIPISSAWDDLDSEARQSTEEGVQGVIAGNSPEKSHADWCLFKLKHGWTYGPVKDTVAKTHPCLIPYADLPANQRVKDELFVAIVQAIQHALEAS